MMMRTTVHFSALAVIGGGVAVWAQDVETVSPLISFYEAGVLCAQDSGVVREAPDTVAGTTHVIEDAPPFVSDGRLVPAVLGIGFGVRAGATSGMTLEPVTMSVSHPPFAGSGATAQSFFTVIRPADNAGITFYQFDHAYELALGDWTMAATLANGTQLYQTTFTVVDPRRLPDLADVCGYRDLFS